jgi:uroporphyrinogen-III decarboxylase
MHDHAMTLAKVPASRYYTDGRFFVDVMMSVFDYYDMDLPLPIGDTYNYEAEALGAKMVYGENSMPTIDLSQPLIKEHSDLFTLKPPNPMKDGRMPYALEVMRVIGEYLGVSLGFFCSHFSLACGIRTYPLLIRDMRKNPEFVHDLFTFLTDEVLLPFGVAMRNEAGVRFALGADAWAAFPNLTPRMVEEWIAPYSADLRKKSRKNGLLMAAGTAAADYCEEEPTKMDPEIMRKCFAAFGKATGAPLVFIGMGRGQDMPLEVLQEYALENQARYYGKLPIIAAINARFVRDSSPGDIVELVKRYIDVLAREGHFLLFFANIPADTPPENILTAIAAARTYGRYPIAEDLDEISFKFPERESYDEWLQGQPMANIIFNARVN